MKNGTSKIELSKGLFALVDSEDLPRLTPFNWFAWVPANAPQLVYAVRKVRLPSGKWSKRLMHREILGAVKGQKVDHENRLGTDNRKSNLRFCTDSQNAANSRQHADAFHSNFKGVTKHKRSGKWQSQIQFKGKRIYLGLFAKESAAAKA